MADEDSVLSAGDLQGLLTVEYSTTHIRRRCNRLVDAGLLQRVHPDNAIYQITDKGRAYLNEEYDVREERYIEEHSNQNGTPEADEKV
ncbi:hypothetical protein EFA46_007700 [Halarchaeum sp. CBA1220]|uniref:hypothetical protein n=1 Tax=Halarchaeum sp. CBA1220 TaxID=1853682 RepID=UPI0011CD37D1|nr:hypothetical protein [Halarchaeum sp. CBA1220]QLC34090.1 hypothetical protein EFA46_007700 [Halarchaeum sp. CBA1220]